MIYFVVHPGYIGSRYDKDIHYIDYFTLIKLYGVNPRECINADNVRNSSGQSIYRHLYPRYLGDYNL